MIRNLIEQSVETVLSFSSQYGSENSQSYNIGNLVGPPSKYPNYGDFTEAAVLRTYGPWWKTAPSAWPKIAGNVGEFVSNDFVDLLYQLSVFPTRIEIYETYNPGAVVRILAWVDATSKDGSSSSRNRWIVLWTGQPKRAPLVARKFCPPIKKIPFQTRLIRLELNSGCCSYYTEMDAVILYGKEGSKTKRIPPTVIALEKAIGTLSLSSTKKEALKKTKKQPSLTSQPSIDEKECSGYFNILPNELVSIILSYLTLREKILMCCTCRYFSIICYDPMWYRELNLQPYWHQIRDSAIESLQERCQMLERINLSWIGHRTPDDGCLVSPETFERFLKSCGKTLRSLQLSCSDMVNDRIVHCLPVFCSELTELDLSSCKFNTSFLVSLAMMKNLRRLNLYRLQVADRNLIDIFHGCQKLEHLNVGSNMAVQDPDHVLTELGNHCRHLRSLDLWRWKRITSVGIQALVFNCSCLEELDLGWCGNIKSQNSCIQDIAQSCPGLKKLFLTAVRSTDSNDVITIASCCRQLEQFDILGTAKVSPASLERLLGNCPNLQMLDISFCSQITADHVNAWRQRYPKVAIQKSFTN